LRILLAELGVPMTEPTKLRTDNDGVLTQSTKAVNHTAAKHYRIAQAYIREKVAEQCVAVAGEQSALNESDIFTKALPVLAFELHQRRIMGPQSPGEL
jgi:hypothetical protein